MTVFTKTGGTTSPLRARPSFIGCDSEYEDAKFVLFGAPFDSTTSFRPGTRFASPAMRAESARGIEMFSPYQNRGLEEISVCDAGDLELPFGSAARSLEQIEAFTGRVLDDGKIPVMLGGEHLVTLGAVRAAAARHSGLAIVHFDAHADLCDEFFGEALSHATVIRRAWDIVGDNSIFQFGIRSGCREEFEWAPGRVSTERFKALSMEKTAEIISGRPIYITLDLDVLDPSEFPGTGTPEAGGISFTELLDAMMKLAAKNRQNIVGFDLCELSPHYDTSGISTAAACKILREMLLVLG